MKPFASYLGLPAEVVEQAVLVEASAGRLAALLYIDKWLTVVRK